MEVIYLKTLTEHGTKIRGAYISFNVSGFSGFFVKRRPRYYRWNLAESPGLSVMVYCLLISAP